ncbi:MAG: hypothetical protein ACYDDU_08865 [Dermatophilaceae bacterium]
MDSKTLHQPLTEVNNPLARSVTLAPAGRTEVAQARRVTENDWRLTLDGTHSLACRLEAVVHAAPDVAQGTCRTMGRRGRHHVRLEIGCRGPRLLASLLEAVIDDHAMTYPHVRLLAMLQVDDSMRPRRIDLLVPSEARPAGAMLSPMLDLVSAQGV